MKKIKWAQFGEFVSSIAVVATLVFLVFEVRENTGAVRTESYGESIDRLNNWRLELASSKELTGLFTEFRDEGVSNFDVVETQQFNFI